MTPDDIARDRAVIDAATEAEWAWFPEHPKFPREVRLSFGNFERDQTGYSLWCTIRPNDAAFIAAARTRWPAALNEVERLRAENTSLKAEMARLTLATEQPTTVVCDCGKTQTIGVPGARERE